MTRFAKLDANGRVVDFILAADKPEDADGFHYVKDEGQFAEPIPEQPGEPMPHAMIDGDGLVISLVKALLGTAAPAGHTLVLLGDSSAVAGWTYADGVFTAPPVDLDPLKEARKADVMRKRDERIEAGLTFNGYEFQTRVDDRENVQGAAQLASIWLMQGGDANTLRWSDPNRDFVWIDAGNVLRPMSATIVIQFGEALAKMKSACIFHALELKQTIDAATTEAELRAVDINAGWP